MFFNTITFHVFQYYNISCFEQINILLYDSQIGVIKIPDDIFAIGHRVVHGKTIEIYKKVIRSVFPLNILGIEIAEKVFPKAKEFAVAFHHKITSKAHRYALIFYIRYDVYHGISHQSVYRPAIKIITLHLGNGASIAVIKEGISTDPSMGFYRFSGVYGVRSQ